MKQSFVHKHNVRKSFGKIPELTKMPNLLEIQKNSYELFLQRDVKPEDRDEIGLQAVFKKVFHRLAVIFQTGPLRFKFNFFIPNIISRSKLFFVYFLMRLGNRRTLERRTTTFPID